MLFGAPGLLSLLIVACVAAPTSPRADISDPDVARQEFVESYSTPQQSPSIPGGSKTTIQGAYPTHEETSATSVEKRWWSVPEDHETQPEDRRPWPPGEDGSHTITYCFENQASYDSLHEILALALIKWEPAIQASALAFAPDSACNQVPCLCITSVVAEVTLRISLADPKQQVSALATVGYIDRIVENPYTNLPRSHITWPRAFGPDAALLMAHELGERLLSKSFRNHTLISA